MSLAFSYSYSHNIICLLFQLYVVPAYLGFSGFVTPVLSPGPQAGFE